MHHNTNRINFGNLRTSVFLVLAAGIFFSSCSDSKQANNREGKSAAENGKNDQATNGGAKDVDYTAISTDICDCVTDAENSLGSNFKNIIISASKSEHHETALQSEMVRITDTLDQQKLMEEFRNYKKFNIEGCMKNIEKKYPGLNPRDKEMQNKLLDAMEENCSEFSAAIMKMGFKNGE